MGLASQTRVYIGPTFCGSPTYADDMSLVASSMTDLQGMLDIVAKYAKQWCYTFNAKKSKVMVFGKSMASRKILSCFRVWAIDGRSISETNLIRHLGITLCITGSSLNHTLRSIASSRSAFYSLQYLGPRFGCLHPITALKLFKTIPLSILRFGLDAVYPTKSELLMRDARSQC